VSGNSTYIILGQQLPTSRVTSAKKIFGTGYDGAWWRHEAPSAVEMMEEAWKSGRQVRRLLVAMDR